tara:strand:- start:101 stop:1390 length:1290 start_codon:yes stop_codon:yes gene_type:complete
MELTTRTCQKQEEKKKICYDDYRQAGLQKQINYALASKELLESQKAVLLKYYEFINTESRINSLNSILSVLKAVKWLGIFIKKPYNEATEDDVRGFIHSLKVNNKSVNYRNQLLVYIRAFYKWHMGNKSEYPENVKYVKPKFLQRKRIEHSELLTWPDIEELSQYCFLNRDKAMLYVLRDTGGRMEETLLRPQVKDLIADKYGFRLRVNGKTGERYIRLLKSIPALKIWLNEHKYKHNSESPLFYVTRTIKRRKKKGIGEQLTATTKGQPIKHSTIETLFLRLKKSSKFTKPINPHAFRHASATDRAILGFQEKELRIIYGWAANSNMPEIYCNFSDKEVDKKILAKEGKIEVEREEMPTIKFKVCKSCHKENRMDYVYCIFCANPIDDPTNEARIKEETNKTIQWIVEIAKNPELMKQLEEFRKTYKD